MPNASYLFPITKMYRMFITIQTPVNKMEEKMQDSRENAGFIQVERTDQEKDSNITVASKYKDNGKINKEVITWRMLGRSYNSRAKPLLSRK